MEAIKDVLQFLNYLDFVGNLGSNDYSNFNQSKKILTANFQDVDSEQLIHMLGVIDELRILFLTKNFQEFGPLRESTLERIFTLYENKTTEE